MIRITNLSSKVTTNYNQLNKFNQQLLTVVYSIINMLLPSWQVCNMYECVVKTGKDVCNSKVILPLCQLWSERYCLFFSGLLFSRRHLKSCNNIVPTNSPTTEQLVILQPDHKSRAAYHRPPSDLCTVMSDYYIKIYTYVHLIMQHQQSISTNRILSNVQTSVNTQQWVQPFTAGVHGISSSRCQLEVVE